MVGQELSVYFALPAIEVTALDLFDVGGTPALSGEHISPCLKVLPMRFTWSLYFAQWAVPSRVEKGAGPVALRFYEWPSGMCGAHG